MDAILRDSWAQENIIYFETKAAGSMDAIPCIVIRGICNYANSHKNKIWQLYVAATAALCAKELLLAISAQGAPDLPPAEKLTQQPDPQFFSPGSLLMTG
ncbi:hypothetical protein ASPZODRAFT_20281 [Penicilliopsis zonata CBS 506.65]|uniref:Nucleoside phosphorylase domain-containing protein n=1 Tax=Penicilliopsis zonata CBS 506.65 TaxID=1073090 RepID=A0A1L9S6F2_9EURO|nr:hypothetical protein ASPZODRAFT_20281 [Penicilliopsis zonata CBS 506.65]OJJ42754.1 hypothetical protein ASPZODRAFT_20281 [Penicilliopsis zonata CBS 506.65]